ncbi:putative ankyrin repeat protein-like protein [Hapsidospora chrysogenum ATCC 11550]|uniref:Putative ankyrin repeat protein-like protein n=1 Tax=Hapsidospora chrysogenum (strain ATCC 11550 / CBS 779.69 / DSM 880 / IAM 14645 / JCM 23072 / IMI 49137) TaxID=857340 RepID=A0A086T3F9_HAPC1|nr:putative ankyrin repeat protein-like protein [Hapsidospora chrysogenum ATCC 11550]
MSINDLPVELVELIANKIESAAADIHTLNALSQACRGFHALLNHRLYRYDANHDFRSMEWAIAYEDTHHRMDTVRRVIEQVPDALNMDHVGRAVVFHRWDIVETLIRMPPLREELRESVFCDAYDTNVFIEAAIANREDTVRHLFALAGPKVLQADKQGKHPLLETLHWGSLDTARLLIDLGADVQAAAEEAHCIYPRPPNVAGPISALCLAAGQGSVELVKAILKGGAEADTDELTKALRFAVHGGHPHAVELLIGCGAEVPPGILCAAARRLNPDQSKADVVGVLLSHGASANENCPMLFHPCSPLASFASINDAVTLRMLLRAGANAKDRPAMWAAVTSGVVEMVQILVEHGADVQVTWNGRSPLWYAVARGHEAVVDYLIECGADVRATDHKGRSLLHRAVQTGSATLVGKILSTDNVNVDAVDNDGCRPLQLAVEKRSTTVIDVLVARGADVNGITSATRRFSAGIPLVFHALRSAVKVAEHLIVRHGAGVSTRYEEGNTLLHLAGSMKHFLPHENPARLIKALVQKGADINALNNHQQTPLHVCVSEDKDKNTLALTNLLDAGADTSICGSDSEVPFVTALIGRKYWALSEFERHGHNLDKRGQSGLTPLMETSRRGLDGPSDWLLERGVEVNEVFDGKTALDMVPDGPLGQMGLRLLYHGADSHQLPPGVMEALRRLRGRIRREPSPTRGRHEPTMRYFTSSTQLQDG